LPDIEIDDNGTPEDTSDDLLANVESLTMGSDTVLHFGVQVDFDAAGNLYAISNASELLRVFSPGGDTLAITDSTGTFSIDMPGGGGVLGDYNDNGVVDAADYVLWRNGGPLANEGDNPGTVEQADYEFWRSRFGAASGSGSVQAAVPEPGTLLASVAGLFGVVAGARCRRKQQ
jgi:hypothetical protein